MKIKFKYLVCCTVLLTAAFMGGCAKTEAPAQETQAAPVKDKLVYANFRDIRDLNPHLYAGEMYAQEMLYETLISLGPEGFEPCLAESWEISGDGLTYTFRIREGVTFTDGEVCDANAIQANFKAIMDNGDRHSWLEFMQIVDRTEATDDRTFVIKVKKAYEPLLMELAVTRPFAMISPKAMKEGGTKDGVNGYIGTGPYVLKSFEKDQYAIFERNEAYWGQKPAIKTIEVKVIPDNQARILALKNGEIDLIYGKNMLDAEALKSFEGSDAFGVALSEPTSTRQILMNTKNPILNDKRVRQALQHATDRETISEGIFYGYEKPAGTLYAETLPYCSVGLVPYSFDTVRAAALLEEAGWAPGADGIREKNGQKLKLSLLYNVSSVTEKTIAEYLQSAYREIGAAVSVDGQEEQSYRDRMKAGDFDLVFNISWGTPYDPYASLAAMRQTVYGDYAAQEGLAVKEALHTGITDLLLEADPEKRQDLYKQVLSTLHEEALYLTLTYESNKAIYSKALQGVGFAQSQYEIPFARMHY